ALPEDRGGRSDCRRCRCGDRRTDVGKRGSSCRAQFSGRRLLEGAARKEKRLKRSDEGENADGKRRERAVTLLSRRRRRAAPRRRRMHCPAQSIVGAKRPKLCAVDPKNKAANTASRPCSCGWVDRRSPDRIRQLL